MPSGPCPANLDGEQDKGGVRVIYHATWDGVSVRDSAASCDGPLVTLAAVNPTGVVMYAHFEGKRGAMRHVQIPVGFDNTANPFRQPQLRNQGLETHSDLDGLTINSHPTDATARVG
jgi:hypothetical protein